MISIVTTTWDNFDFLQLLIESIERFSSMPYELIVVDNSTKKQEVKGRHIKYFPMDQNIGHGAGLNFGVKQINESFPFVMFLDDDSHFLRHNWESHFLELMKDFDVVGGKGVPAKPIRPACMWMKRDLIHYDWRATESYSGERGPVKGFDVAIQAYHKMIEDKIRVGFMDFMPNHYKTLTGEVFGINQTQLVYHHWHGSSIHLECRQADFPGHDLFAEKAKLFSRIPWRLI